MKRLLAVAALLLASSAAQAQYSFEYGGRTIRIDPDRGTVSIPGVYDNTGKKAKRGDSDRARKPQEAKVDPQAPAATPAPTEQPVAPASTPAEPPAATANVAPPSDTISSAPPAAASTPAPQVQQEAAPIPRPGLVPAPVVATAPAAAPAQKQATATSANSPLGVWLTEEKEGRVRIEQCGANLCGYSVNATSNQNDKQILIDMKPGKDKWSGRIFDPKGGSTYDSTIVLKSPDSLRVQGCAMGGVFCGGQTWSRVN
jgi:uncharacterized protein (DUF2147 family)